MSFPLGSRPGAGGAGVGPERLGGRRLLRRAALRRQHGAGLPPGGRAGAVLCPRVRRATRKPLRLPQVNTLGPAYNEFIQRPNHTHPCHAHPLPCMPPCHAHNPCHTFPPAMYSLPAMYTPTTHKPLPFVAGCNNQLNSCKQNSVKGKTVKNILLRRSFFL